MEDEATLQRFLHGLQIMEEMKLTEAFGHLSMRLPDGSILITPARGPGMASADDLVQISPDGERIGQGNSPLPLETPMHLSIYNKRNDVKAICRTHSRYAVSLGAAGTGFAPLHGFGLMLGRLVRCHQELDLIHTISMGDALAETLADGSALLVRGNGAIATGESIPQAVVRAIYLEEAARIEVDTRDRARLPIDRELHARRSKWHPNELKRAWDYYVWKCVR